VFLKNEFLCVFDNRDLSGDETESFLEFNKFLVDFLFVDSAILKLFFSHFIFLYYGFLFYLNE
jgi:hypothetical protein